MIIKFAKKIKLFLKKEDRKIFSLYKIFVKIIMSIFIILLLPIIFFIIFIIKEPREIISINKYFEEKIKQINNIKDVGYKTAKLSFNKNLEFVYDISDLEFNINNISVKFPKIIFKTKTINLLKEKVFFNEIEINDFVGYFGYDNKEINKNNNLLSYKEVEFIVQNILDYFNNKRLIFKKLNIHNSNYYLFNENTNSVNKIDIIDSLVYFKKKENNDLDILLNLKFRDKNKTIKSNNNCIITTKNDVNCILTLNNIFMLDIIKILAKDTTIEEYLTNIDGVFNLKFDVSFKDYTKLIESNFNITSEKGSFFIRDLFPKRVYYTNLDLYGNSKDTDYFVLDSVKAKVGTNSNFEKNDVNFLMSMNLKNKQFMNLNIDMDNAKIEDIHSFWPLFLDGNNIRQWVVEHFKTGNIDKIFAYMNFDYIDDKFTLTKIKSEVDINNTILDYADNFPIIDKLSAKAIFTVDDMNIYINGGYINNTKILNGKVYTNFDKPTIDIKGKAIGNAYEMFYFINNNEKDRIKNIVNMYIDGMAYSNIKIDIPLYKDVDLDSVFIDINSNVKNNNTVILSNNSEFNLSLIKDYDSNKFKTKIDLKKSYIDFNIINFVKNKNLDTVLNLDIIVNNDNILIDNIYTENSTVNLTGKGEIVSSYLRKLNINNIKYNNSSFNVEYISNEEDIQDVNIDGEYIELNLNKKTAQNNNIDKDFKNVNINCFFNNILINNKYIVNEVSGTAQYKNNILDNINLFNVENGSKNVNITLNKNYKNDLQKYSIDLDIKNLGKFLNDSNINSNLINGNLKLSGYINKENQLDATLKISDNFSFITKDIKNIKFFSSILNSDLISKKTKNKLNKENSITFDKMYSELIFDINTIDIKSFVLESDSMFGIGISGKGKLFIDTGKINFNGLVIPADKINTLFGINKIPVINNLLFDKNGGLFTVGYTFDKESYNSNYEFKLIPISTSNINSIKNVFLLLFLL